MAKTTQERERYKYNERDEIKRREGKENPKPSTGERRLPPEQLLPSALVLLQQVDLILMEVHHVFFQSRLATAANEDLGATWALDGRFARIPRAGLEMALLLLRLRVAVAAPALTLL